MKDNNYEFHVGDEVETIDGMVGKIVGICHCEKCAERGFFEPKWETPDGKYSDYITVYQKNCCFPDYRRIGKYVWNHETDEEKINENILQKENRKMKEIKLTIDGKEVKLTDEQLKVLGIEPAKTRKNPFEKPEEAECYYFIDECGVDNHLYYEEDEEDDWNYKELCDAANMFNDGRFAEQVALHQLLYRKLLKYSYDNECEDNQIWGGNGIEHWTIRYNFEDRSFEPDWSAEYKYGGVYFSDREGARLAINKVVKPFMKEHPDFVW